jgi:dienelactone hydrolase
MIRQIVIMASLVFVFGGQTTVSSVQDETSKFPSSALAFVELLRTENFKAAVVQFDDTMKAAMPEAKLQETWAAVLDQVGAFKSAGKARAEKRGEYVIVFVTCEFQNSPLDIRVVFDQGNRVAGLGFSPVTPAEYAVPAYVKLDAFREKEITIGQGEWALPGTLTMPSGAGPFPLVILVHGSGPHDRDATVGPNKPFKDLAWGLASTGVAVLRYEKRTRQHSAKLASVRSFTVKEEVLDDVLAAVAVMRTTEGIDSKRIFVLGHSLGGMLVPHIGRLDENIAGLIALAGATRPLEDAFPEQYAYIFSLDGNISAEDEKQLNQAKADAAKVKALKPEDANSTVTIFGAPASYWLDLRGYDPPYLAKTLKQPLLILQGERDYQVTLKDFERWKDELATKKSVSFKLYSSLNHFFISGTGRSTPSEYAQVGHVDEQVIADIAAWIKTIRV